MREYLVDQLIASAKRRGRIPDSAFTADEWLQIVNEEMETYLAPLIQRAQEDYYLEDVYFSMSGDVADWGALLDVILDSPLYEVVPWQGTQMTFRIPARAQGGALRAWAFLDASGNTIAVPRISIDDLEQATWGCVLQGQTITYVNRIARAGPVALKMTIAMRPSLFCRAASAARIASLSGKVATLEAIPAPDSPLTAPSTPAPAAFAGQTLFDVVKATPGFEVAAYDRTATYDAGASTLTFDADLPSAVAAGDYVALANYTPIAQCPTALWALLAQSAAATALEQMGSLDQATQATQRRELLAKQVLPLLQNRVKGSPQSVIRRHGILFSSRRW